MEVAMNRVIRAQTRVALCGIAGVAAFAVALLTIASTTLLTASPAAAVYHQTNLVSDQPGVALLQDSHLVNPWGISFNPSGGAFWVANNGTGVATLYRGDVNGSAFLTVPLVVTIPGGVPTGTVINASTDFVVSSGAASGPALFRFASQVGIVSGWNPGVPPGSTEAQIGGTADAVYTGLAIGKVGTANFLYACDFEHGAIDVYDKEFHIVQLDGSFSDPNIPNSYSPFNIQNLGGRLYVTYAQQSHKDPDEETG